MLLTTDFVDLEKKTDDLERGLINGAIPGTFLIQNASSREWYQVMVNLSNRARDPNRLRAMIRGILRLKNLGNTVAYMRKRIVGVGSAAFKILSLLKDLDIDERDILFLDSDPRGPRKSPFSNLQLPWANMLFMTRREDGKYVPLSWGGIHHGGPSLGRLMALGWVGSIAREFENVNSALMVAALGGATGSGVSPIVAGALKEMGIKLDIIVQIPFPFEGKKAREDALESLEIIQQYAYNVIVVEGREVLKKHGREMSLFDAFKALDLEMASRIKGIYGNDPQ